ncbi:hypothetical protein ACHWQZ_G014001 [Mnemiopsis leidyi]
MTRKRRHQRQIGPGSAIFGARTLHLPNLVIKKRSDIMNLEQHLDGLVKELTRLKFCIRSFAKDFIARQYILLKYDLYFDTLNHLYGWHKEVEEGRDSESANDRGPTKAYRMIWGLVKGITESTITIMYLDELHPDPKSAFEDLMKSVMRGFSCRIYISKSNEKSVTMLQHYVEAGEEMTQLGTAVKNKYLENRKRDKIMIQGVEEAVKECGSRKLNVLHGPPGCGKTYTGVHLAFDRIFSHGEKVLFVARRNVTIDDFLIKYRKKSKGHQDSILRLGSLRKADANSTLGENIKNLFYDEHRERWKRKRSNRELVKGINRQITKIFKKLRDVEKSIQSNNSSVSKSLTVTAVQIARNTELKKQRNLNPEHFNNNRLEMEPADDGLFRAEKTAPLYTLSSQLELESVEDSSIYSAFAPNTRPDSEDEKIEFHKTMIFSQLDKLNTFDSGSTSIKFGGSQSCDANTIFHLKSVPKDFLLPSIDSPVYKTDSKDMSEEEKRKLVWTALMIKLNGLISRIYKKYDLGRKLTADLARKRNKREALFVEHSPEVSLVAVTVDSLNQRFAGQASILAKLNIQTVIVDEASEIFTSDLMATLPSTVQKLIVIGDHKQLQPRRENRIPHDPPELSFMNFLMEVGVQVNVLAKQFRMVPDLFNIQRDLYNYEMVHTRRNEERMKTLLKYDMYWWDCQLYQSENREYRSSNPEEGWRAVHLARLLTGKCSREKTGLVILTGYKRQVKLIEDRLKQVGANSNAGRILVSTIDGFQGLERETVILSLVRNCDDGDVGFMADRGRRAVALSRARDQLYIIGDATTFAGVAAWKPIVENMRQSGHLSSYLPLQCVRHPGATRQVESSRDLEQIVTSRSRVCEDCGI